MISLAALITALKEIFKIGKGVQESKKTGLEIQKLEKEKAAEESPIKRATIEDIKEYDPKVAEIRRKTRWQEHYKFIERSITVIAVVAAAFFLLHSFKGELLIKLNDRIKELMNFIIKKL